MALWQHTRAWEWAPWNSIDPDRRIQSTVVQYDDGDVSRPPHPIIVRPPPKFGYWYDLKESWMVLTTTFNVHTALERFTARVPTAAKQHMLYQYNMLQAMDEGKLRGSQIEREIKDRIREDWKSLIVDLAGSIQREYPILADHVLMFFDANPELLPFEYWRNDNGLVPQTDSKLQVQATNDMINTELGKILANPGTLASQPKKEETLALLAQIMDSWYNSANSTPFLPTLMAMVRVAEFGTEHTLDWVYKSIEIDYSDALLFIVAPNATTLVSHIQRSINTASQLGTMLLQIAKVVCLPHMSVVKSAIFVFRALHSSIRPVPANAYGVDDNLDEMFVMLRFTASGLWNIIGMLIFLFGTYQSKYNLFKPGVVLHVGMAWFVYSSMIFVVSPIKPTKEQIEIAFRPIAKGKAHFATFLGWITQCWTLAHHRDTTDSSLVSILPLLLMFES